ncbi:MAG: hypothetical protein CM1200mP15_05420 [Dehalococcoidia bacterium]|nr:MAG: hypothetical protein CM1200mP15_05420 [Dehalococcoidia bacterium]
MHLCVVNWSVGNLCCTCVAENYLESETIFHLDIVASDICHGSFYFVGCLAVFLVLGSRTDPDVYVDNNLGKWSPRVFRNEILDIHYRG